MGTAYSSNNQARNNTNLTNDQKLKISKNISNYKKQSIWNNYNTENFSSENPANKYINEKQYNDIRELLSFLSESDNFNNNEKKISHSNEKKISRSNKKILVILIKKS